MCACANEFDYVLTRPVKSRQRSTSTRTTYALRKARYSVSQDGRVTSATCQAAARVVTLCRAFVSNRANAGASSDSTANYATSVSLCQVASTATATPASSATVSRVGMDSFVQNVSIRYILYIKSKKKKKKIKLKKNSKRK